MMCYLKKLSIGLFTAYCLIQPAYAEVNVTASAKILQFDYEEFDLSGQTLNKETGHIPGFSIAASTSHYHFKHNFNVEAYNGQVDYNGQTQSGAPHFTDTNETVYRLYYQLNWSPENYNVSLYGKTAWQQWDRDILPARSVSGLFEQYRWWAIEAGALLTLAETRTNKWLLEFGTIKIDHGTIEIDLSAQGFGRPKLDLGDGAGLSAGLMYEYKLSNKIELGLSLQYQRWTFGRSNTKFVSNGIITAGITEPRSVSNHTTLSLLCRYHF